MREDRTPSVHSSVVRLFTPYSSPRLSALGFRGKSWCAKKDRHTTKSKQTSLERFDFCLCQLCCSSISTCQLLFLFYTDLDELEARRSLMVESGESTLQGPPRDGLATACFSHQHCRVSGVLGLVELDDFGHGEGGHLKTARTEPLLNSLLQLRQNEAGKYASQRSKQPEQSLSLQSGRGICELDHLERTTHGC